MKVSAPLYLIKGNKSPELNPRPPGERTRAAASDQTDRTTGDFLTLVRSENRRAQQPDPGNLAQARELVADLMAQMHIAPLERLSAVHQLEPALLTRLF